MQWHSTTAITKDLVSIIPFIGADKVVVDDGAFIRIAPMTVVGQGGGKELETLSKLTEDVSNRLSRWPKVKALWDDGEEHFISSGEAAEIGLTV